MIERNNNILYISEINSNGWNGITAKAIATTQAVNSHCEKSYEMGDCDRRL